MFQKRTIKRKLQTVKISKNKAKAKKSKKNTACAPYKEYTLEHVKIGLLALINGKSKRSASELSCGVPASTLRRHFKQLTGKLPNMKQPLNKTERADAINKLNHFEPKLTGQARRLFTRDEELLMVEMLEVAASCAFPYNADALEATALNLGKAAYGKDFKLGKRGKWRLGFEKRHKERISKVKSGSMHMSTEGEQCNGRS